MATESPESPPAGLTAVLSTEAVSSPSQKGWGWGVGGLHVKEALSIVFGCVRVGLADPLGPLRSIGLNASQL